MATLTLTTTVQEDAVIAWVLTKENARRTAAGLPVITFVQYLQQIISKWEEQFKAADVNTMRAALENATLAEIAAVKATLKL